MTDTAAKPQPDPPHPAWVTADKSFTLDLNSQYLEHRRARVADLAAQIAGGIYSPIRRHDEMAREAVELALEIEKAAKELVT